MAREILIAESDKLVQEEFERIFETTHYQPIFVDNDEEALLRGKLFKPELIIGGKALCQSVRMDQELKHIPFILLLDLFDDLSEKERERLGANGMLSRPLNEEDVLKTLNTLSSGEKEEDVKGAISEAGQGWKSFADIGKPEAGHEEWGTLDEAGETDEEIIELVDVVEEPESRMSIEDFAFQPKDELPGDIPQAESWGKLEVEEEISGKEFGLPMEEKREEEMEVSLRVEKEVPEKKGSLEDELFEKVELEEILRKVERLQPSLEKEWPAEKEAKAPEATLKTEDRFEGLDEFEAALKGEVKPEPADLGLQPIFIEGLKEEPPIASPPEPPEKTLELQELAEEEFPEIFLEELTDELEKLKEEELLPEEKADELESETIEEQEIAELLGEGIESPEQESQEILSVQERPPSKEVPFEEELIPIEETVAEEELPLVPPQPIPEISSPLVRLDRTIEEVLTREVQEMMQDFASRIIPEMTKQMITLTMERIEAMVKGIVPDLAEKAIREELERLQKEEKG